MADPVALYREPGRTIMKFRDLELQEEFNQWVEDIQPTLRQHNIQITDPIQISLPTFTFTSNTSLARRMNRLHLPDDGEELNLDSEDEPEACVAPAEHAEHAEHAEAVEHVASVEEPLDEWEPHRSVEQNFHRWAQSAHPGESLMSFLPLEVDTTGTLSDAFNAHTASVDALRELKHYFVIATDHTNDLNQSVTFLDGTVKHIDTQLLFNDDEAVEHTLMTLMNSETPMYLIEYLN